MNGFVDIRIDIFSILIGANAFSDDGEYRLEL